MRALFIILRVKCHAIQPQLGVSASGNQNGKERNADRISLVIKEQERNQRKKHLYTIHNHSTVGAENRFKLWDM